MPLAWRKNRHDPPSQYIIYINGRPLTIFLCRMEEAQSTATYDDIRRKFGKEVHAVGVAKGDKHEGECQDAKYPDYVKVIRAPIYYQGSFRADCVEKLCTECETACCSNKAIVIHCNHSFHRGPSLLAAIMIKAGSTKKAAFGYIAQKRTIYHGHVLDLSEWPLDQQQHHATKKLIEAHKWLDDLESGGLSERFSAYPVCSEDALVEDLQFCALEARLPSWFVECPSVQIDKDENPYIAALSDGRKLRVRNARGNNNIANQIQKDFENPLVAALSDGRNLRNRTNNTNKNNFGKIQMDTHIFDDKSDAKEQPGRHLKCIHCLKASSKYSRICWLMEHFDAEELHLAALRKEKKHYPKRLQLFTTGFF